MEFSSAAHLPQPPIHEQVEARRRELERSLRHPLGVSAHLGSAELVHAALSALEEILGRSHEERPAVIVDQLVRWIERSRSLGERAAPLTSSRPHDEGETADSIELATLVARYSPHEP